MVMQKVGPVQSTAREALRGRNGGRGPQRGPVVEGHLVQAGCGGAEGDRRAREVRDARGRGEGTAGPRALTFVKPSR